MSLKQNEDFLAEACKAATDRGATIFITIGVIPSTGEVDVYQLSGMLTDEVLKYLQFVTTQIENDLSGNRIIQPYKR